VMTTKEHPIGTELLTRSSSTCATKLPQRSPAQRSPAERLSAALDALLASLEEVRSAASPDAVLERAPRALAASAVFERVMLSPISGSLWALGAVHGPDGQHDASAPVEIALASPLVEAEVVRRRLPALVSDARHEDRVARYLVDHLQFDDYVVAPVTAGSAVIALLHADHPTSGLPLTTVHRDLLRMFADGVGLSYEKAMLLERIERQRRCVLDTCEAAALSVARAEASAPTPLRPPTLHPTSLLPKPIRIGSVSSAQSEAPSRRESRLATLTSREREVLALLASGATNAQLADRLTVAESTVKSHVKHILHKLSASNRAAAISYYLRETRAVERSRR